MPTPEKKPLTWDSVLESLENLVNRRGENFVYKRPSNSQECVNFNPGNHRSSCAVGVVLYDHGYRHKDLKSKEDYNEHGIFRVSKHLNLQAPASLLNALAGFQGSQDFEIPYGKCLYRFKNDYKYFKALETKND